MRGAASGPTEFTSPYQALEAPLSHGSFSSPPSFASVYPSVSPATPRSILMAAYGRMVLPLFISSSAQCYALEQSDIIANISGFNNYRSHAMFDKGTFPKRGRGMNFNTG